MQKTIELLHEGDKKLIEVANAVGDETDAAFSKAFKRVVGEPPDLNLLWETVAGAFRQLIE